MNSTEMLGVGSWVSHWADVNPNKEVIVFQGKRITYLEFNRNINRTANALLAVGVKPGDRVACLLLNCPEYLEIVAACQKIGVLFVPVNNRLVSRDLKFISNNCEPTILFTESQFNNVIDPIRKELSVTQIVYVGGDLNGISYTEWRSEANEDEPVVDIGNVPNYGISYTSGTTGIPKGVVLTQSNVFYMALQLSIGKGYTSDDRHTLGLPLCFTGALVCHALPILLTGATMIMEQDFEANKWLGLIEEERITRIMSVPTVLSVMADHPNFKKTVFRTVRSLETGGTNVPEAIVSLFQSMGIDVILGYGCTEVGGQSAYKRILKHEKMQILYKNAILTKHKIFANNGHECAVGEVGEICMRGPTVMKEYWRNPNATAETIRDGWLHTGDLGTIDSEGNIYIVDRKKDMVISGGINIYPAEVEQILYECEELLHVAVIGLPHPKWGEAVTAIVVPKPGEKVSADRIKSFCRENLANFKVPLDVIIVNELPTTSSGKIMKNVLREQFKVHYNLYSTP